MRKRMLMSVGLLLCVGCLQGCAMFKTPAMFPDEGGKITAMILEKIGKDGTLEKWAASANVHAVNPGMEGYAKIEFSSGVRIVGVDGEVNADSSGSGLPPDVVKSMTEVLNDPNATKAQKDATVKALSANP